MEAGTATPATRGDAERSKIVTQPAGAPAPWTKPLVRIDEVWTKIETYLVLGVLLAAILYMCGWVTLNAFHTKGGKLARFPGTIAVLSGVFAGITWARSEKRAPKGAILPGVLLVVGAVLLAVSGKAEYFANVAQWLENASLIKQMGTPEIVSARLFTIWAALLGGSLATAAGRQINIDLVMRFVGPKVRLGIALFGYLTAATACFVISWGFLDYIAITGYGAEKSATVREKLGVVTDSVSRHAFLARRQFVLDLRSFGHVVLAGKPYDKWFTGGEWNAELNDGSWAKHYPPGKPESEQPPAIPYPTKPCLSQAESDDLSAKGGAINPTWRLPGSCHLGDESATRAPLANAPEPDDRRPLEADLSLLFPWGFFVIGLRFLLRGALAGGGAVSTDPNAAHGADVAHEPPIVEPRTHAAAEEQEGEGALPADDVNDGDVKHAALQKVPTFDAERTVMRDPNEYAAAIEEAVSEPTVTGQAATLPPKSRSVPPEGLPTAQRIEAAAQLATQEEEEKTLVGDLSELAMAQEIIEAKKRMEEEIAKKKKGGK
jgi:hypothetical protein